MSKTWRILLALLAVFALVASSCGNDDDDAPVADTPSGPRGRHPTSPRLLLSRTTRTSLSLPLRQMTRTKPEPAPAPDDEDEPEPEPEPEPAGDPNIVELGGGAVIDITECPDEWDNFAGITDTEIRFGSSLPAVWCAGPDSAASATASSSISRMSTPSTDAGVVMVSRDDGLRAGPHGDQR